MRSTGYTDRSNIEYIKACAFKVCMDHEKETITLSDADGNKIYFQNYMAKNIINSVDKIRVRGDISLEDAEILSIYDYVYCLVPARTLRALS